MVVKGLSNMNWPPEKVFSALLLYCCSEGFITLYITLVLTH